jgi:putative addiction module killer protein
MVIMELKVFVRDDDSSPFQDWFDDLDAAASGRVTTAQLRLASGNTSNIKWFSGIGEFRINWGPGYRIYLAQDGDDLIILYVGGTKKSQQSDIAQALLLHQEYERQKQAARAAGDQPDPDSTNQPRHKRGKK